MADTTITDLHPDLQPLYAQWLQACTAQGLNVRIIQGWRDPAYQDQLHSTGVSPLTGESSFHCFTVGGKPASKAFDYGCFKKDKTYIIDGTDPAYALAGQIAESLGLTWGGRFVHPAPDWDHIQLAGDLGVST